MMSYCREEGQDKVIFMTKEDDDKPISEDIEIEFDEDDEPESLIRADGTINWECPCLGNMISGPCGVEVRQFFSCFHDSNTKGGSASECIDQMRSLDKCMTQYPELYPRSSKHNEGQDEEDVAESLAASTSQMELEMRNGDDGHNDDGDDTDGDKKSL
ncbi:mitochondrial intermembrane space import and assembly protein 40-B-like [Amphiura filiformis]|uniref:mitochondrial intermembrane space import and assembly protein 40-B-like n=1 Tax=Amphiura filiformis TaxID=82378 RepID=UPI003B22883C